jgi:hypothetical protein
VEWTREGETLSPGSPREPDSLRAFRPWVLEDESGALRMWYSGHDGTTWRILEAVQRRGEAGLQERAMNTECSPRAW